jgi:hypothetical protein
MVRSLSRRAVLAVAVLAVGLARAEASDYCPPRCAYKTVTYYKCLVVLEERTEAYTKYVTRYDHCGCPYQAAVTCYRKVQVPVKKYVACTRLVKVCD